MKKSLALATLFLITSLSPVHAAPIGAAISAIAAAIGVSAATVGLIAINLTVSAVMSVAQRAKMKKAAQEKPGIKTEYKRTGGINSRSIVLGRYATNGAEVCPPYSRGNTSQTPNIYLTYIISLCDVPSDSLNRIIINGEYVPITDRVEEYGNVLGGKYISDGIDYAFIKFYDGSQTTADPKLVEFFGTHEERPWTAQHVGRGITYAIVTFRYNADLFKAEPEVRYELNGAKLYDPRKDSSRGGSGPQRLNDPTTWAFSLNPIVMVYNIQLGIPLMDGRVYGVGTPAADLPLTEWVAAMNICDEPVTLQNGTTEPRYRAGYEIHVAEDEPGDVIDALLNACSGSIVEIGGVFKVRAGGPGLPVMFVEDGDFIVTKPQDFDPFPPSVGSHNTFNISFPHPEELWQPHDAPTITKAEYVTRDGGDPIIGELTLNAVPYPIQAQRIGRAWLEDDQRWRSHSGSFGPYALHLEPLDVIAWTSARNGYINKHFDVNTTDENLKNLIVLAGFREVDPTDYDWQPSMQLPDAVSPGGWRLPAVQAVPGFAVEAFSITDADGVVRRAAIRCFWNPLGAEDARALNISYRQLGSTEELDKSVARVDRGTVDIVGGVLPNSEYEVRAIYDVDRPVVHTSWFTVRTGAATIGREELDEDVQKDIQDMLDGLTAVETDVTTNRQNLAAEVARAKAEAEEIRGEVILANEAIEAEELRALHEADLLRTDLADVRTDLATVATDIRGELVAAQNDFAGDLSALHATVTNEYGQAISTGITNYDLTVQGQFTSIVGQIEELTAKLTSADLIQNGKFQNADLSYWTATGTVAVNTKAAHPTNPLVQSAPTDAVARIEQNGAIEQVSDVFALTAADRFRVRFSAAGAAGSADTRRRLQFSATWLDGTGAVIGSPSVVTFTVAAGRWGVVSHEFDPPDNAVRATVEFRHVGDSAANHIYITTIEANTADQTIEADIITIKAAQATLEGALATYKTEVAARFGSAETAISSEATTRAAADSAMGQRVDTVQANIDGVSGRVTTNTTAIATANGAITALDTRLSSTFGDVQLLKDGEFLFNLAHWPEGNMTTLVVRDKANANPLNRDMPGAKAIRTNASGTSTRATERFPVALSERYAFGFYGARNHGSAPFPRVTLAFEANDGTPIAATGNFVNPALPTVNTYVYAAIDDVVPPIGATHARLVIEGIGTPNSTRFAYATGLSLRRMAAQDVSSAADIATLQTTFAGLDQSFASYKTEVATRFGTNETLITNETTARTNADSALGGRIDSLVTRVGTAETAITSETTARTNADSALGGRIDSLTTRVGTSETKITSETAARTSADSALGVRIDSITTRVGKAESDITSTQTTLSNLDEAFGQYKTAVNTRFGTNETAITNETTARTNADSALGGRIDSLVTRVGGAETRITATETAITTANAAIGSVSEEIQTKFGDTQLVRDPDFNDVLKYWTGGTLGTNADVVARNKASTDWRFSQMPGRKALNIRNGMSGGRLSPAFDVSPSEVYDLAFYVGRTVDSASVKVGVRWLDSNGAMIGTDNTLTAKPPVGKYETFVHSELKPPATARSAQVIILYGANGTAATGNTFLSGITLRRRAAFEFASAAGITEAKLAASDVDSALTSYKSTMNTRVGKAESDITDERTARVDNDKALNDRIEVQISRINAAEATITTQGTTLVDANAAIANVESVVASKFGNMQLNRDPDFGDGLKHYGGALPFELIQRNTASTSWTNRDMPGRAAALIKDGMTGSRTGPFFDASPSETFEFGFYSGRQADGPRVQAYVQWLNTSNQQVGTASLLNDIAVGAWKFNSVTGIKPPEGTAKGRVVFTRNADGGGNVNNGTYITGLEVWRQTAAGVRSEAAIEEVRQTAATATQSLAALDLSTATKFGHHTGWGRLRVQSVANAGGSVSRIALTVAADGDLATPPVNAGLYLEARSDGNSQIVMDADRLVFAHGFGVQGRRYPFFIDNGVVYMNAVMIKDGQITNAKIGNIISTPGYQPGQSAKGWIIDKNGDAEFNRVVIRRQLQVASGTVPVPFNAATMRWTDPNYPTIAKGVLYSTFALTNIPMTAWQGTDDTYIAVAGISGATGTAIGTATGNELFGYTTKVAALTKWSGTQQLRIIFEFYAQGLSQISAHNIDWTLYKVS